MVTRVRRRKARNRIAATGKSAAVPRAGGSLAGLAGLAPGPAREAAATMLGGAGADPVLRSDAAARAGAESADALAWARPGEIGFGPGPVSEATQLHELAHSVQFAGGNRGEAAVLSNAHEAEREAHHAVPGLQRGQVPRLSAYRGSGPLFGKPAPLPGKVQVPAAEMEGWVKDGKDVWYQAMRKHVRQVLPGASEQQVIDAIKGISARSVTGKVDEEIAKARKRGGTIGVAVDRKLNQHLANWLKKPGSAPGAAGAGGKGDEGAGKGDSGSGAGKGTGTGEGAGAGSGGAETPLGISDKPREKLKAKTTSDAVAEVQAKVDAENAAKHLGQTELEDADGNKRFWPNELADPKERAKIVEVMKAIVGEPPKLPEGEASKLPVALSSDEGRFLLQIANADEKLKAAVIARLKGSGELKPPTGQTMSQVLETAFENVEIEAHADELGVDIKKGPPSTDPSKTPIENRPVRGSIVSGIQSALSVGERAVWKFEVHDDRDAFRVPHIYIHWLALRTDPETKVVETVSSENTHNIPVRAQGIINDSEFDFTARKTGPHVVKAIVQHNFFKPAYFEEPFVVEEEFPQAERVFDKENEGLVAKADRWDEAFFDHGGDFDYRLGRMRRGKLDPKAKATTDDDLIATLEEQKKLVTDNVAKIVEQDKDRAEDLNKARDERIAEIEKQIKEIRDRAPKGAKALVARGQFVSRVRGIEDVAMQLSCSVSEVQVVEEETGRKRTEFLMSLNDGSARGSRKIYHWTAQANSVQAAQRALFIQVAEAYPFGTVSVLFQGYDHQAHAPTSNFVQFEKKTDTVAKDIKSVVFDETVDTVVNVVGFVLSIIPVTAPIGIAITVVYNTAKGVSDNLDDAETGNFESKKGAIALGDLVLNLLPLAPKVVKVGKAAYFVIKASSIAGGIVLMGAVGMQQVRELRIGTIDALVKKKQRYDELKRNNKSHPEIVSGSLEREIKQLTSEAATATQSVFTQMAAQAVFMHVVSASADKGFGAFKELGPVETRVLPGAKERKAAITPLKEQGGLIHQEGATPKYDYKQGTIVADEGRIKPGKLEALSREAGVDRQLKQAGMAEVERAAVGDKVAALDVDVVAGSKTELAPGSKGRPELRVKPGATAGEVQQVLKDNAAKLKPEPNADTPRFIPLEKPLPGSAADGVGKKVNARLSDRAKAAFPDVQVEIAPPGEFGPSKTRAAVQIEGGKVRLRFEREPRPGALSEEIAHLEQLADPKFAEQRKALESLSHVEPEQGAVGGERKARDWSSVSEKDKVAGHKARLELEADAQRRVISDLEAHVQAQKPGPDDPRVHDIDAAYQNLEQLRSKLEDLHALGNELETTQSIGDRPDYLDAPPQLTNKQTTNKFPPPKDWTRMTQKEFVKAYKEMYPDTKLTVEELKQRHRNGERLNPDSGRKKNPSLVDNPTPDVPAKLASEQTLNVDDMKIGKQDKQRIKDLLAERDRARKARDAARDGGDEARAAKIGADVNEASRQIGEAHAEAYMRENHPGFELGYPEPGKPSRSGDFDQVWIKYGDKARTVVVEVIVIEAKGGSSPLGARRVDGLLAQQGSGLYFKGIVDSMRKGTPSMQKAAKLIDSLPKDKVQYKVVRAPIEMTEGAKPVSVVVKVEVGDFDLKKTTKKP